MGELAMKHMNLRLWPQALALAGMVSAVGAVSAFGAAGDNGQYFMLEGLYLAKDNNDTIALTAADGAGAFNLITSDAIELSSGGGLRMTAQFDAFGSTWQASAFGVSLSETVFNWSAVIRPSVSSVCPLAKTACIAS